MKNGSQEEANMKQSFPCVVRLLTHPTEGEKGDSPISCMMTKKMMVKSLEIKDIESRVLRSEQEPLFEVSSPTGIKLLAAHRG